MPKPKHMAWMVALAGATYFALEHMKNKTGGAKIAPRWGA